VSLFLVIFGYFWLFLVIFGYFWLFLVIFGYFWLFLFILRMGNWIDVVFCTASPRFSP